MFTKETTATNENTVRLLTFFHLQYTTLEEETINITAGVSFYMYIYDIDNSGIDTGNVFIQKS